MNKNQFVTDELKILKSAIIRGDPIFQLEAYSNNSPSLEHLNSNYCISMWPHFSLHFLCLKRNICLIKSILKYILKYIFDPVSVCRFLF